MACAFSLRRNGNLRHHAARRVESSSRGRSEAGADAEITCDIELEQILTDRRGLGCFWIHAQARLAERNQPMSRQRNYAGPAIFSYGFRPYFFFGSIYAAVAVMVWLPVFHGHF